MHKLNIYQCDEITIHWFKSYLQGRSQCISFKGKLFDVKTVTHGIPQGNILVPLLFIAFMNVLPLHTDSCLDMYADDSTLCATGESVNELNKAMSNVKDCYHDNQMASDTDKTKRMVIATYQKEVHLDKNELIVYYDNTLLENVDSMKLLGVSKYLPWNDHVN